MFRRSKKMLVTYHGEVWTIFLILYTQQVGILIFRKQNKVNSILKIKLVIKQL